MNANNMIPLTQTKHHQQPHVLIQIFVLLLIAQTTAFADPANDQPLSGDREPLHYPVRALNPLSSEPWNTGWSLNIDNDLIAGGARDQDYTGGIALTLSGKRAQQWPVTLETSRRALSSWLHFDRVANDLPSFELHSMEFGFALFTPQDITISESIKGDHPYASLFFMANAEQRIVPEQLMSYQSILTVGILGLGLAETVQRSIHNTIGSQEPEGWDNQISNGGEPTARLTLGVQRTLLPGGGTGLSMQLSVNAEANVGFTTDAATGFSLRWGRLARPWYTFNPHQAEYINIGSPVATNTSLQREYYVYLGGVVKYRLYNAILQGQCRDSAVTFDRDELKPVIVEAVAGVMFDIGKSFRGSLFLRARSAEVDKDDARSPRWGGFILSRSFSR